MPGLLRRVRIAAVVDFILSPCDFILRTRFIEVLFGVLPHLLYVLLHHFLEQLSVVPVQIRVGLNRKRMSIELTFHHEPFLSFLELLIENPLTLLLVQLVELLLPILLVPGSPFESALPLVLFVSLPGLFNEVIVLLAYSLEVPLHFRITLNVSLIPAE